LIIVDARQWPGYNNFKRQIQIRDETPSRNPITIAKFANQIGRRVRAFLQNKTLNTTRSLGDDRWIIGQNEINWSRIRVIGAIHVSAGSWMPILQLNDVWVFSSCQRYFMTETRPVIRFFSSWRDLNDYEALDIEWMK